MTLTIVAILQPTEHDSRVTVAATHRGHVGEHRRSLLVLLLVTSNEAVLIACDAVAVFGLFAIGKRSYFWTVAFLTPTILLLISAADYEGFDIAVQRALYTVLGIVIGLTIAELFWRSRPAPGGSARELTALRGDEHDLGFADELVAGAGPSPTRRSCGPRRGRRRPRSRCG